MTPHHPASVLTADPKLGETIGYGPNRMRVERIEPGRVIARRSEDGNWVWTFVVRPDNGPTRLSSRKRFRLPTLAARMGMLPMEPASLPMERKMRLGIKRRAERLAADPRLGQRGRDERDGPV
jgi:hypothetical protein